MTLVVASTLALLGPSVPAFAAESLAVTKTASANVLVGVPAAVTLSATNNGDEPEYNLGFRDQLPLGVTYVAGSAAPASIGEPRIITAGNGQQTLLWENVSDLPVGASQGLSFQVLPAAGPHPVGSTFTNTAQAYANSDPRTLPRFNATGGYDTGASVQGSSSPTTTSITAIKVDKTEPSPEHELIRGVHDHSTPYTLTVTNNSRNDDDDVILVDLLPAQLEFLGCGTVDNTPAGAVEYTGAARLDDSTPDVADCISPATVSTVTDPAGVPAGVYTRLQWNLGTLAPSQVVTVVYRAGIPQRANTATFPAGAPTGGSLGQIANLDNNTGASTRETSEQSLTNRASVSAVYTGAVATGTSTTVGDDAEVTVTAEDLAMQKSVAPGKFTNGGVATYTLALQTGEYADASNIVITDQVPHGLCPLDNLDNYAGGLTACDKADGFEPSLAYDVVSDRSDGGFTVVFDPISIDANGTRTVTYQARMLVDYRGSAEPTVAGDSFTNTVALTAQTTTLADVAPPGGVSTVTVTDESSATLESDTAVLDKQIQGNTGPRPYTCATGSGGYANSAGLPVAQTTFTEGSRVCFMLRIDFPAGTETKNAVLKDFLPDNLDYETGSAVALTGNTVATSFDAATLVFTLGSTAGSGGNLFVQPGGVFLYRISAIVNGAPASTPAVTGNLAKLKWTNTGGRVSFLRDREDFSIAPAPPVSITKAANRLTSIAPGINGPLPDGGNPTAAERIRAGDVVQFTVTTRNDGTAANRNNEPVVGPDVWDRLAAGIECGDVSAISDGGVCTDPGDGAHPTFADRDTRSAIRWDRSDTVTIAAGATLSFTYRVTFPSTVAAGQSYRNDVDVASYATSSNIDTRVQHYPASNVDTTVTAAQIDVPRAHDDHTLRTPAGAITKTNDTQVDDPAQGTDPAGVNYVAIGETVTYTVAGTVPANTSIYNGVLSDTTPTGIRVDGVVFDYRAAPGDAYGPLPGGFTTSLAAPGPKVTFPVGFDAGAADDSIRMTITATTLVDGLNVHAAVRTNLAQLTSTGETGTAPSTVTATSSISVVEPAPAPLKSAVDPAPRAGQPVSYTLTARNMDTGNPGQLRPTLFEAVMVDCLPDGLTVAPGSLATATGTVSVGALGANGCAADRTPVVWQVGDLPWRSVADASGTNPWPTLTYDATVSSQAGGGVAYTNTASLSGTSMDGADPDEKTYSAGASATVTVPGGVLAKSVTPDALPVGGTATYELKVDLPASVNFYDASFIDRLPTGISTASVQLTGSTCTYADVTAGPCTPVVSPGSELTPSGDLHGWLLGDVAADSRPRTVTVTYTAVVGVVATNTAGTQLTNSALLKWNQTNKTTTPGVGDTFDSQSDPATATVRVTEPLLSITKTVNTPTPGPGADFTYTVRITNATGANVASAHDVDLVDTIPAGVRVIGSPSNGGVAAGGSPGGGTITWNDLGPIARGEFIELTYTGRLVTPAPSTAQTNVADITGYTSIDDGGRTYDGPTDDAVVTPALPILGVTKVVLDAPPAYIGEPTRWRMTVTNTGPATAFDVDVDDVLPTGWTYDAGSARVSVAGAPAAQVDPDTATGSPVQTLHWENLGDLTTGQSILVELTATPGTALAPDGIGSGIAQTNEVTVTGQDLNGSAGSVVTTDSDTASTRIDKADLTMNKVAVGTPVAGQRFSWTLTVANTGPDTAAGPFEVTDDLPAQVTGATAAGDGWTCSVSVSTLTCRRTDAAETLASGTPFPVINVSALVPSATAPGTPLANSASVTSPTYETDPSDNSDGVSVDVTTTADFGIVKTLAGPLVPGRAATYTIAVRNDGPSAAYGQVVVTDTLPAGLTYISSSGNGWTLDRSGQTLEFTWTGARPVAVGALPQITVTVQVASSATAAVTNTATVTAPSDPTTGPESPDTSSVTTTPSPSADLGLTKASPDAFLAGTQGVYEMVVRNFGPSDAAGPITVTDTLPTDLTYVSVASAGDAWSCAAVGQVVTCTRAAGLVRDASSTFRLTVAIAAGLGSDVINSATVDGPTPDANPGNDSDTDDTGILVEADLAVAKSLVTDPVIAGEDVTYEIAVRNDGPATSPGPIVVTDTLSDDLTYVSALGAGWSCAAVDQDLTCTRSAALGADTPAGVITVVASVASDAGTRTLTNVANVDGPATDPGPGTNTSGVDVTVGEDTEISVVKTSTGADPVRAGENATFEIVVSNTGSSDARTVTVSDVLPSGMALVSASGQGWTCVAGACSRDRIVAGMSAPVLIVVARVGSGVPDGTTLTNTATVATITPGDTPSGNTDDADVDVVAAADLALDKTHPGGPVTAGLPTSFTISVTNQGPSDAIGPLSVTDTLPAGLSYLSASAPWTCAPGSGAQVTCTLTDGLIAGATAPDLLVEVLVAANADLGILTNSATVSGVTTDPVEANDTDTADVTVRQEADLSVVKSHTGPVRVGERLTFTLDVANAGPSEARDVVVADALPKGLVFVSASGTGWTCGPMAAGVTCSLAGRLAPLTAAAPITVVTTVTPAAYPSVNNVATVSTSTVDPDPTDDQSTDAVAVPALVDLSVVKSHRGTLVVGEQATYELTVSNAGPTSAPGPITITDSLPTGLTYASATSVGWLCSAAGQVVTCTRAAPLGVDESSTIALVVDVTASAYPQVVNSATVSSPSTQTDVANDTGSDTAPVTPDIDLAIEKVVESANDTQVVYSLTVTNQGLSASVDPIRLRDPLPSGLELVSAKGAGWSCTTAPRRLDCLYAQPLAAGDAASVRLVTQITADPGTKIVNVASVDGGGESANGDQDSAAVTVAPADGTGGGGSAVDDGTNDDGTGTLPDTGGPPLWVGLLALLFLGLGLLLTARSRRMAR